MRYYTQGISNELQTNKASVASGLPSGSKNSPLKTNNELFGNLFTALMVHEVVGQGTGEVSEIFGTLRSTPRTDGEKMFSQEVSVTSRVKGVREEYNQDEHRNFRWMIEEAKKLKMILEKFEDVLSTQGGF